VAQQAVPQQLPAGHSLGCQRTADVA
jgi:hypothetical protein